MQIIHTPRLGEDDEVFKVFPRSVFPSPSISKRRLDACSDATVFNDLWSVYIPPPVVEINSIYTALGNIGSSSPHTVTL